jgi:hypothetical protein
MGHGIWVLLQVFFREMGERVIIIIRITSIQDLTVSRDFFAVSLRMHFVSDKVFSEAIGYFALLLIFTHQKGYYLCQKVFCS